MQIGRFEVLRPLGEGGMSRAYRARDPDSGREVALKVLRPEAAGFVERFLREAEAAAALRHPGIVTVHELARDPQTGQPYLAMELVPGQDLHRCLDQRGPLPLAEVVDLAEQLATALDHAHERGVVHRDLKPANVILKPEGQPVIVDFGLASLRGAEQALTRTGELVGTPAFMAPEQALGVREDQGPATDVYGLAATVFYLLTGQPPFSGAGISLYRAVIEDTPPTLPEGERSPQAMAVGQVLRRGLAKDPAQRPASAGELARELRAALEGGPAPPAAVERRQLALLLTLSGLALAVFLGTLALSGRRRRDPLPPPPTASTSGSLVRQAPRTSAPAADPGPRVRSAELRGYEVPGRRLTPLVRFLADGTLLLRAGGHVACYRVGEWGSPRWALTTDGAGLAVSHDRRRAVFTLNGGLVLLDLDELAEAPTGPDLLLPRRELIGALLRFGAGDQRLVLARRAEAVQIYRLEAGGLAFEREAPALPESARPRDVLLDQFQGRPLLLLAAGHRTGDPENAIYACWLDEPQPSWAVTHLASGPSQLLRRGERVFVATQSGQIFPYRLAQLATGGQQQPPPSLAPGRELRGPEAELLLQPPAHLRLAIRSLLPLPHDPDRMLSLAARLGASELAVWSQETGEELIQFPRWSSEAHLTGLDLAVVEGELLVAFEEMGGAARVVVVSEETDLALLR